MTHVLQGIVQQSRIESNSFGTGVLKSPPSFPQKMVSIPQWVCWKRTPVTKKSGEIVIKKRPVSPTTGYSLNIMNVEQCTSFDVALLGMQRWGADGVGFVFTPSDPFTFIDLDHVVDSSGNVVDIEAQRILSKLDSWAEISQSGEGVHIIVAGDIASTVVHNGVEMYSQNRFVALTGNHLSSSPTTINDRQSETKWLYTRLNRHRESSTPPPIKPISISLSTNSQNDKLMDALAHVPGDCDYAHWLKISLAVYSQFPDQAADIIVNWSRNFFHEDDPHKVMRTIFRSSGKNTRVTINSVFWIARNIYGWNNNYFEDTPFVSTQQTNSVTKYNPSSPNKGFNGAYLVERSQKCSCGKCTRSGIITVRQNSYHISRVTNSTIQECNAMRHQRAWRITQQVCEEMQYEILTLQTMSYEDAKKWKERNRKRGENRSVFYSLNCMNKVHLISNDPSGTKLSSNPNRIYDTLYNELKNINPQSRSKGSKGWGGDFKGYRGMGKDNTPIVQQMIVTSKDRTDVMKHIMRSLPTISHASQHGNEITTICGVDTPDNLRNQLLECDHLQTRIIRSFPRKEHSSPEGGDVPFAGIATPNQNENQAEQEREH